MRALWSTRGKRRCDRVCDTPSANYLGVPISTVRPALSDNAAVAIDHPLMARHGVLTDAVGKGERACVS